MGASGFSGFRALGLSLISKPGPNRRSESLHLSNPIPIPQTPSPKPETSRREQTTSILSGLNERQVFGLTSSRTSRLGELKGSERLSIRFWGGVLPFPFFQHLVSWSVWVSGAPGFGEVNIESDNSDFRNRTHIRFDRVILDSERVGLSEARGRCTFRALSSSPSALHLKR